MDGITGVGAKDTSVYTYTRAYIWGIDNILKTWMHKMATKWKYCQRQWNYTQRFANLGSNQWMNNILCIKASLCRVSSMTCSLPCSKDYKHCCQVSNWDNRRSLKVEGLHVIPPIRRSFESEGMCYMVHIVSHCYKNTLSNVIIDQDICCVKISNSTCTAYCVDKKSYLLCCK